MTRRDWWLGVGAIALAVLVHAAVPRYEWHPVNPQYRIYARMDRWTGRAFVGRFDGTWWKTFEEIAAGRQTSRARDNEQPHQNGRAAGEKLRAEIDAFLANLDQAGSTAPR